MLRAIKNWLERRHYVRAFEKADKERAAMRAACKHTREDGTSAWVKVSRSIPAPRMLPGQYGKRQTAHLVTERSAVCLLCARRWSGDSFKELESLPPPAPRDFTIEVKPNGDFDVHPRPEP